MKTKFKTMSIRVSEDEYNRILEDANQNGQSVSSYLKQIIFAYANFAEQLL